MSEPKWRPGPWFLEGNWDEKSKRKRIGGWLSSNPPCGVPIFEMNPIVGPAEEAIANAYLCATAPDLYDALYNAQQRMAAAGWDTDTECAVLEKARGER